MKGRSLICKVKKMTFVKDFLMINKKKADFCFHLGEEMLKFDNSRFRDYLI